MPVFTVEKARLAGLKSVQVRRQRAMEIKEQARQLAIQLALPKPEPVPTTALNVIEPDRFSADLSTVCEETLALLRKATKPMERAQLARSLRDLRETWHLATGKPRPGLAKEQSGRMARREMPRTMPASPGESVDRGVYGQNPPEAKPS